MAGVTKEEIARAKELDLLTYFKLVEPGNLKLVGKEYRHKVHSSLTISKDSLRPRTAASTAIFCDIPFFV